MPNFKGVLCRLDREIFVQNVKDRCKAIGVKPTVACRESGVGSSFITELNRGQIPSVGRVQMLAAYLGMTTSELLGEESGPAADPGDKTAPSPEEKSVFRTEYGGALASAGANLQRIWQSA